MKSEFDIVVAGGGHNSLVAAAYLARAGLKVLVLERNAWLGGGVVTREVTLPGFRHDLHSTGHMLIQSNPLICNDELGLQARFGLKYIRPEITVATLFDDGTSALTYFDLDKTCESFAKISPRDAESYRRHVEKMRALVPMFVSGLYAPPAPFGTFLALLEQSRQGRELIGVMNRSAYDIINEVFESDKLKMHFMKYSAEAIAAPEEKGTGLVFSMLVGIVHSFHGAFPVGGSAGLTDALARCIEHDGGEIRKESHVARVITEGGRAVGVALDTGESLRAKRAVIGCFHPHLLDRYVEGLDPQIVRDAQKTEPGPYSLFVVNCAVNGFMAFPGIEDKPAPLIIECLPSSLEHLRREFDELRYQRIPEEFAFVCVDHSRSDPSRAPAGKSVLYIAAFAPYNLADGGADRWDAIKEQVADRVLDRLGHFSPSVKAGQIIARHVASPRDHERTSLSFQRGDVSGIGRYLYQFLGRRPTPELSKFAVPGIQNLYLTGPFMHPGGGVIGGGRATAVKVLGDLSINFDRVITGV